MKHLHLALFCLWASLLAGCVDSNPPISLHDRFVLVALTDDAGRPLDRLYRWPDPLRVQYHGPDRYRDHVAQHAEFLGAAAGLPVRMVPADGNMIVKITDRRALQADANRMAQRTYGRDAGCFTCFGVQAVGSTAREPMVTIGIANDLSPLIIHGCIVQEMTQTLGLYGDLDGRTDTNFASRGGAPKLTDYDRQLLAMLYDGRLLNLMPRGDVLAVLPFIVADVEAELR